MNLQALLGQLFPAGYEIAFAEHYFCGRATVEGGLVAVVGMSGAAELGIELAHRMAGDILSTARDTPGRPILIIADTSGQRLSRRDELLGLNGYLAHLVMSIDAARAAGSRIIGLVHGEAVSGAFLATAMMADACYALPSARISVMNLPAMARVTRIPLEQLQELSKISPVFAPGPENFLAMGALADIWSHDLALELKQALAQSSAVDRRRIDGERRGGRTLARAVSDRVRHGTW